MSPFVAASVAESEPGLFRRSRPELGFFGRNRSLFEGPITEVKLKDKFVKINAFFLVRRVGYY